MTILIIFCVLAAIWLLAIMASVNGKNKKKPINKKELTNCPRCGSTRIQRGYYSRGWNNLCNQAAGDEGYWCESCCEVTFIRTIDEYNKIKQDWVTAWR